MKGACSGLLEKTAVVELEFEGSLERWSEIERFLRERIDHFFSSNPLYGVRKDDWPFTFLLEKQGVVGLGEWVTALTIALQRLAGDPVGKGRVVEVSQNNMHLALPWERQGVCQDALKFGLRYLLIWGQRQISQKHARQLDAWFAQWIKTAQEGRILPNSFRFALAARARNIPVSIQLGILQLGWGSNAIRMNSSFTSATSLIATRIAKGKMTSNLLLKASDVPVPDTVEVSTWKEALAVAEKLGWPIVVKPGDKDRGEGVVTGILDQETLRHAFDAALNLSQAGKVIVEKYIEGNDHRMLVVGGKLFMATRRIPGGITGDGSSTVFRLIDQVNADPSRGKDKHSLLIVLERDKEALSCLAEQGLTEQSIPEKERFVYMRRTANISRGGTAIDVTGQVHPDNRFVAERSARLIGLDIAGVDFICPDISRSWREVGGAVIEINAQPGFRPHWISSSGRDINGEIIDWLFHDKSSRIPTAAITGTNGKTTVARMLHHIWLTAGALAGVCTTSGVWVGKDMITDRNLSGYPGAQMLLRDPAVETAVIEMPRKGLLKFGHPCDRYDVAALLNVRDDHIGVDGIDSLREMANLKAGVLERATMAVVVNAEDALCMAALDRSSAPNHILVSGSADVPTLRKHLLAGGQAVFAGESGEEPWMFMAEGELVTPLMSLSRIPATMNGMLYQNQTNALFAAALAWAQGIKTEAIRKALGSFSNTPEQNPGRYNFIEGFHFQVLLDYGHNPDGIKALCDIVGKLPVKGKRRLLNLKLGSRHRKHLVSAGHDLAQTFDSFVLGCDPKYVNACSDWFSEDPEFAMISFSREILIREGVASEAIVIERDQNRAIRHAIAAADFGDLLVLLADPRVVLPILKEKGASGI